MNQKVIASALFAVLAGLTTVNAQSPTPSDASAATPTATPQRETKAVSYTHLRAHETDS